MAQSDLPKPGDLVGQRYRIVSRVGAGGMGVVFEAVNVATEGHVALKWLNPELSSNPRAVERFKTEARATGRIQHPNVVAIHDIGEGDGTLFLVMELLKGESLRARLGRGPLALTEACKILLPVMRGVAAAHKVGVLHRDIKPENIFMAELPDGLDPVPKILDFGIAKLSSDSENAQRTSLQTGFLGTYPFMAFEQLHARGDLDVRVDVYALGAVLYNMVTGKLPYEADNAVDLALRMMQAEPLPATQHVPALPAALDAVFRRALAREREQRYPDIESLATALEPFADSVRFQGSRRPAPAPVPAASPQQEDAAQQHAGVAVAILTPYRPSQPGADSALHEATQESNIESSRRAAGSTPPEGRSRNSTSRFAIAGALAAVLVGSGVAVRFVMSRGSSEPSVESAKAKPAAAIAPPPLPVQPTEALAPKPAPQGAQIAADDWEDAPPPGASSEPTVAPPEPAHSEISPPTQPEVKPARQSKDELAFEAGVRDLQARKIEEAHEHFGKMSASSALRQRPEVKNAEQKYAALRKNRQVSAGSSASTSTGTSRPTTDQSSSPAPLRAPADKSFRADKPSRSDFMR